MGNELLYSAVQYSANPDRFEALNVGVVVYDPSTNSVSSKVTSDFSRLSKAFGQINKSFIALALSDFVGRVKQETDSGARDALKRFQETRSNNLYLTPFLPVNARDLSEAKDTLFDDLVGNPKPKKRATRLGKRLRLGLQDLNVLKRFDVHPEQVTLPRYNYVIRPDLGIRGDHYNLIEAVRFDDPQAGFAAVGEHALAGRALHNSNMKSRLIVVGDFGDQPNAFYQAVREDLLASHTSLYRIDDLRNFVAEVVPPAIH